MGQFLTRTIVMIACGLMVMEEITLIACDTRYGDLNVECNCNVMNMMWI